MKPSVVLKSPEDMEVGKFYSFQYRTADGGKATDEGKFLKAEIWDGVLWYHFETRYTGKRDDNCGTPYEYQCFLAIIEKP